MWADFLLPEPLEIWSWLTHSSSAYQAPGKTYHWLVKERYFSVFLMTSSSNMWPTTINLPPQYVSSVPTSSSEGGFPLDGTHFHLHLIFFNRPAPTVSCGWPEKALDSLPRPEYSGCGTRIDVSGTRLNQCRWCSSRHVLPRTNTHRKGQRQSSGQYRDGGMCVGGWGRFTGCRYLLNDTCDGGSL